MLLVRNIRMNIREMEEEGSLRRKLLKKLKVTDPELISMRILKESIDARKKPDIYINFSLLAELTDEKKILRRNDDDIILHYEDDKSEEVIRGEGVLIQRPVVVGFGPAGIFAALTLAEAGLRPIVLEMGKSAEERTKDVEDFWRTGVLKTSSNVQFGEGGAGTFSDGKLTTRIKDPRIEKVIKAFIEEGADPEIAYRSRPHVGTDVLKGIIMRIRERIISLGGEVRFSSFMEDISVKDGRIEAIKVSGDTMETEAVILALGHSSRDTYSMLYNRGAAMEAKAFAVGLRVEHLQKDMDMAQYGDVKSSYLRASEYTLSTRTSDGRGVYSFCMCPGGFVVNSSSEEGLLCVNGMSYHARDGINANSAVVASVSPSDFGRHPLDGMKFQREMERRAFILGGGTYSAPCQNVVDFLDGRQSQSIQRVSPTITPGYRLTTLHDFYPFGLGDTICEAMQVFGRRIKGFDMEGIFTGIETRTSAPLRIIRNEHMESINIRGLYPAGEGAGYAGGIMSAAVDGIRVAEAILQKYGSLRTV